MADKVTVERRVEEIYRLILDGWTTAQILQKTSDWGLTGRQRESYIAAARKRIRAIAEVEQADLLAEHIAIRRDLRRKAEQAGDRRLALAVAKDEAELLGLYPAKRTEVTGADGKPVEVVITYAD
jgi:hypothetical protein